MLADICQHVRKGHFTSMLADIFQHVSSDICFDIVYQHVRKGHFTSDMVHVRVGQKLLKCNKFKSFLGD
jgi:hypothetical protein